MNNEYLIEKIVAITEKTKEDKISWSMTNAQTMIWVKTEKNMAQTYTLTIQSQPKAAYNRQQHMHLENFTFTFQSARPNQVLLQLNSSIDPTLRHYLANLFHESQASAKRITAKLLEMIIEDL